MRNISQMPVLKLAMSKKTKDWKESCVDFVIGTGERSGGVKPDSDEMQTYYDLYNGIYSEKDLKYVTNPFNQKDGFPAMAQNYNIIKPKIDLLLGEETKRPFNFRVVRTSDGATSEIQDKAKLMLTDYVMATIMSKMSPEEQVRYQQALQSGEIMQPEAIQKYLTLDYKDIAETTAYHTLGYLKNKLNINHEFFKGWKDSLIAGIEVYYTGIINGNPMLERVNPMYFDYDDSADIEFIHDAEWCCRKMVMSASEIYDRFYDKMTEKQLDDLLEIINDGVARGRDSELRKTSMDYPHYKFNSLLGENNKNPFSNLDNINVWHACWKSFKKIGFVSIYDPETESIKEFQVDEQYKPNGTEQSVEWTWVVEVWEGYRIGDELYVGIQPIEYQHISADNPNSQKLPYTGVVYNSTNSVPRSLVSIMKPLQYMYIVLWYRLELAMSRDKGKVPVIDITQIPKSMNIDVNKWMHYLSALGVMFVNPYEEGWDIPGREGGKPSQFNQFSALDLSMANTINQYIGLMAKIEDMLSEITGVSRQREGSISSSELVGNVERSVTQSAHITEPWFWMHNQVKKHVLTMLLDTARHAWKDEKQFLHYILDDSTRAFIKLSDEFFYEDMDIFVDDSTRELQRIEQIRSLVQPAMQNGATLLDAIEIYMSDNVSQMKNKMEDIEAKRMEQQQQMQQAEQQAQIQQQQAAQQLQEENMILEEAKLDLEKYKIDQDNLTKLAVAEMNALDVATPDANENGVPDVMEVANQALQDRKQVSDEFNKRKELDNKHKEAKDKNNIEKERIVLEREKMRHETALQKQKDNAAMKREKLKADTALKNKVAGEKSRK